MSWSGKFKNGESFNDLTDEELGKFESEIDESSVKENTETTGYDSIIENNKRYIADKLRDKAYDDYTRENPAYETQIIKEILPRTSNLPDSSSKFRMIASVPLDIASLPGRAAASLGAGIGDLIKGNYEDIPKTVHDVISRPGANPENSGLSQFAESTIKDPFLIPSMFIPVAGITRAGSIPKALAIGAGIGAGTNLGLGLAENIADTKRTIGQDLLSTGIAGGLAGGLGSGVEELASAIGRTPTARAILKKFTPSEVRANQPEQLANAIKKGWDVDVRDNSGNIDAVKLGKFLDKQSSEFGGSRQNAYQDYVDAALKSEGSKIGLLRAEKIKEQQKTVPLDELLTQAETGKLENKILDPDRNAKLIDAAKKATMYNEFGERRPVSEEAINDFIDELSSLGFTRTVGEGELPMNDRQLAELNTYIFNAAKETSPKYHPSKEQFAAELRKRISDELSKTTGKEGSRYSALKTLQDKMSVSKHFNPDRPATFGQGIRETASEILPDMRKVTRFATAGARHVGKTKPEEIPTQTETNLPEPSGTVDFRNEFMKIKDRQTLNAAMRALDAWRQNPNDSTVLETLKQYYTMKK